MPKPKQKKIKAWGIFGEEGTKDAGKIVELSKYKGTFEIYKTRSLAKVHSFVGEKVVPV